MSTLMLQAKRLADEYVGDAYDVVSVLRRHYPYQNLLQGRRTGSIPQQGDLPEGIRFEFHGIGCLFQTASKKLDLDFGPDGRCDGFDAWRLHLFANENDLDVGKPTLAEIEEGLAQLERIGEIEKPRTDPSPHLYYFSTKGQSKVAR